MEKIFPTAAAANREQLKQPGFNYDKLTELLVDGIAPAKLAEHFTLMYFDITCILTHPEVMDIIGISYNWNVWLQELGSLIESLVYMNRYNLHTTGEAV